MTKSVASRVGDYVRTFKSVHGQRVLADMHRSFGGSSFSKDPLEMARREGRREVLLLILRLIKQRDHIFELEEEGND